MKKVGLHGLAVLAGIVVLLAVFSLYADPQLMVQMAEQLWSCFG